MSCEAYQETLIDLAAAAVDCPAETNGAPSPRATVSRVDNDHHTPNHLDSRETRATQAHLESCRACRAAFAQQQALFAAIDSRLQQSVCVDIPDSFLPKAYARLAESHASATRRILAVAATPLLATFVLAAFVSWWRLPAQRIGQPDAVPQQRLSDAQNVATPLHATLSPQLAPPAFHSSKPRYRPAAVASGIPEVLVSPGENTGLLQYQALLRIRGDAMRTSKQQADGPLQISALSFGDLQLIGIDEADRAVQLQLSGF